MAETASEGNGMIDVTFMLDGIDFSNLLSTYDVKNVNESNSTMTAMDGTEYGNIRFRPLITFSLIPLNSAQCRTIFTALNKQNVSVTYTDPHSNGLISVAMRVTSDVNALFGLKSIDGNLYYKGGQITLRSRTVI